jgi:hypothetical protein
LLPGLLLLLRRRLRFGVLLGLGAQSFAKEAK